MPRSKALPPMYLLLALIAMVALRFVFPISRIVGFPWNVIGVLPVGIGVYLNLAADGLLKKFQTTVKPFEESSALISNGVYGFTRHPMYLGFTLILLGVALLFGRLSPFAVVVAFPFLMERIFIGTEERMMSARFGEQWADYKRRVRRWV